MNSEVEPKIAVELDAILFGGEADRLAKRSLGRARDKRDDPLFADPALAAASVPNRAPLKQQLC
jgi:hypothetical protein